jgi:hypothetical protein
MIQCEEILALAKSLASSGDEVSQRTAANRAYYCAYHALLPIAVELPEVNASPTPGRVGHREVMRRLEEWKHPDSRASCLKHAAMIASRQLKGMIASREAADYHLGSDFPESLTKQQLLRTADILHFIKRVKEVSQ